MKKKQWEKALRKRLRKPATNQRPRTPGTGRVTNRGHPASPLDTRVSVTGAATWKLHVQLTFWKNLPTFGCTLFPLASVQLSC